MLRELSLFWSMFHALVLFFLLYESRYAQKKTRVISIATMTPLTILNLFLAFFLDADQMGLILLFTLSLPSLLIFWFLAKNRDGRFFFTFCLVDTVVLEVIYITQILDHYITPKSNLFMFLTRLVIFPLIVWFVIKKVRSYYLEVQKFTKEGWSVFALIGALFYILISLAVNHPNSVITRPEYLPSVFLIFVLIPIIYVHIISNLHRQQKIHNMKEQENMLNLQVSNLTSRMNELTEADGKFRVERHNFRHKLKTLASLIKTEQYNECLSLLIDYEEALDKTRIERYCQHTVLDAVLSTYIQRARDRNIKLDLGFAFPDKLQMKEAELATAIANAFENAINACEKVEPEHRFINIKVLNHPRFVIQIANSYVGEIEFDQDEIPINRENDHGFGTRFIAAFCEKNGGFYQFHADGKIFTLYLNF